MDSYVDWVGVFRLAVAVGLGLVLLFGALAELGVFGASDLFTFSGFCLFVLGLFEGSLHLLLC